jgi:DNA repair protein RadC
MKVTLTKEQRIHILNSQDLYPVMQDILLRENKIGRSKEHIWVVCLSSSNRILLIELISLGTSKTAVIDPTEVFSFALQKRAVKVIMVHNHPSGMLKPSLEDMDITDRMFQAGLFLDVPLIDHLIISEKEYYSFVDSGELHKIAGSMRYVLKYKQEEERLKKLGHKAGKKEGEKIGIKKGELAGLKKGALNKAVEMARGMKKRGFDVKVIAELSGLTKEQIEKL